MGKKDVIIKPSDLRGILKYVPQFRGDIFVISIDGSIIEDENFHNLITDIAVLRSLNIKIILSHGIGAQLRTLAKNKNCKLSNEYGDGPTDATTLSLAQEASALATQALQESLTRSGLKCATINAVRGTETGIVRGKHWGATGKIDRIDQSFFNALLEKDIIPIINPILYDRDGASLRINSDSLAAELSIQLNAAKLIYITPFSGLIIDKKPLRNVPVETLKKSLSKSKMEPRLFSKAKQCIYALEKGPPRAHVLDGRIMGGLLTEIFDKVGIGTMIHSNAYQQIRIAQKKDAQAIFNLIRQGIQTEALKHRSLSSVENEIDAFYVYEIDQSIIGCASIIRNPRSQTWELSAVYVHPSYEGTGVGKQLVAFACEATKGKGGKKLVALSTQSYPFFIKVCGFNEGKLSDLPKIRQNEYLKNKRNSKILVKKL